MNPRPASGRWVSPPPIQWHRQAFTLLEGMVVVAVLFVLAFVFLSALGKSTCKAERINCLNNLKQTGIAFHLWESDHDGKSPMDVPVASDGAQELIATGNVAACFQVMSNELATAKILICPSDGGHTYATNFDLTPANLSYFIGLKATNAYEQAVLSGDANLMHHNEAVSRGWLDLATNTVLWTPGRHNSQGNILLSDGSVDESRQLGYGCPMGAGQVTNCIVIP